MDKPATKRDVWFLGLCVLSAVSITDGSYWFAVFWWLFAAAIAAPWIRDRASKA